MKKKVLILKNILREGPGLFAEILEREKILYEILDLSKNPSLPGLAGYGAVVVLGGPDSANDKSPKILAELDFIRRAVAQEIPFLGICLGMQILAKASGGRVIKNPVKEIGCLDAAGNRFQIELTADGKKDPIFQGLRNTFEIFQLHGETIELPKGVECLATGAHCKFQVIRVGAKAYGFQGHFELTEEMFEDWLEKDDDLKKLPAGVIRKQFRDLKEIYRRTGSMIFTNFLTLSGWPLGRKTSILSHAN